MLSNNPSSAPAPSPSAGAATFDEWKLPEPLNNQYPPSFCCPISRQCMHDPVVLSDGHTYEKRHIEQWLQKRNTSPVTGAQLLERKMFPNHAMRNSIEEHFDHVFHMHRQAIQKTLAKRDPSQSPDCCNYSANEALLRTIESLMQCSILANEDLSAEYVLRRIMDEAKELVGAEVASVFLVDQKRQELYSTVNSTGGEIRIPITAGIAGSVATSREPLVINDAYADKRFDKSIDAKTGFKTRNVVCVPIKTKKGAVLGVAQLINKNSVCGILATEKKISNQSVDASQDIHFTSDDQQFLQVFASQAAAAISNDDSINLEAIHFEDEHVPTKAAVDIAVRKIVTASGGRMAELDKVHWSGASSSLETSDAYDSLDEQPLSSEHHVNRTERKRRRLHCLTNNRAKTLAASLALLPGSGLDLDSRDGSSGDTGSADLRRLLSDACTTWKLDAFALAELSDNKPLSTLGCYLFKQLGFLDCFQIDTGKLARFFTEIERGYSDDNSYHNRLHAASVMHMMYALLVHGGVAKAVSTQLGFSADRSVQLVTLACLIAAAVHDFEHKGLTNDFLVKTCDERAVRYNDHHVNENHHVAAAVAMLLRSDCNFLESLPASDFRRLRSLIVDIVLGTDMSENNKLVHNLKEVVGRSEGASFVPSSAEDSLLALQIAMKCADLGHLALGWDAHTAWVKRLENEFFAQGDKEKSLEIIPVTFLMDREKPGASQTQVGFFDFVVLPLFRLLHSAFPSAAPMLSAVETNYNMWREIAIQKDMNQ